MIFRWQPSLALMLASPEHFAQLGNEIIRRGPGLSVIGQERRFRAFFGTTVSGCSRLWSLLDDRLPHGAAPRHLLWALLFLKLYATEHVDAALAGVDEKPLGSGNGSWQISSPLLNL